MALTLIVSDLHVAAGRDPETGKFSPLDDFHSDPILARLLAYYHADSPGAHLVLNGDTFDLTQVVELPGEEEILAITGRAKLDRDRLWYGLGHLPAETCWKLTRIAQGHPRLFAALATWIEHGNEIHFVIGNHDPELRFGVVQDHLAQIIAQASAGLDLATARMRIHFYDWYLLQPEQGLYVEHGGQYEPLAYMRGGEMPACYFNNRYLFNFLEVRTPEADNIFPFSRYIAWLLSTDTFSTLAILLRQLPDFALARLTARQVLPPPAAPPLCLPPEAERVIRETCTLQHRYFQHMAWRTALFVVVAIALNVFSYLCPLFTVLLVLTNHLSLALLAFLAWPLSRLTSRAIVTTYLHRSFISESNFLQEAAAKFAPVLAAHNVRTIAFGHTHQADMAQLLGNVQYFNTGTWVPIFADDTRLDDREQTYFFIEVRDGNACLLRWKDEASEPETPILIDRARQAQRRAERRSALRRR